MPRPLKPVVAVVASAVASLCAASGVWAYFSTPDSTGRVAVPATSVQPGATPLVSVSGPGSVTLEWGESTLANGEPVDGYEVRRYPLGESSATVVSGCGAQTCTESGIPDGTWEYTVTPLKGTSWRGAESERSGAVTLGATRLDLEQTVADELPATVAGRLIGFASGETIAFRLDDPDGLPLAGSPATASASGSTGVSVTVPAGTSDGPHTVYAVGDALPEPSLAAAPLLVDTVAPTSTASGGGAGWLPGPVTITLSADDGPEGSGVASIAYSLDEGPENVVEGASADVVVAGDGAHTLVFAATDNAGHVETAQTVDVRVDAQPPATTLETSPASPDGSNEWFRQASVGFTLNATDAGSGVAGRSYRIDDGPDQVFGGSAAVSAQGEHELRYWSVDVAGNVEDFHTATVKLDDVAPTTSDDTASIGSGWKQTSQTVTLTRTDATSGAAATHYTTDGSTPATSSPQGTSIELNADGVHTIKYFSVDNAGNTEGVRTGSTQIRIDKTDPLVGDAVVANNSTNRPGLRHNVAYTVYANVVESGSGVANVTANLSALGNGASVALSSCSSGCTVAGVTYAYKSASLTASTTVGSKTFTVTATDQATNSSGATPFTVVVDETNPTVTAKMIADALTDSAGFVRAGGDYYVYADVADASPSSGIASVRANVTNFTSGVTAAPLSSEGGPWTVGGTSYEYRSERLTVGSGVSAGNKAAQVTATDNAGNSGSTSNSNTAYVDNTAPSTTATTSPLPNAAGWNSADVTLTLTASDANAGVRSITYGATGAQPISTTTADGNSVQLSFTTEGTTTVSYFATDNVTNIETTDTVTVKLDKTSPTAGSFSLPGLIGSGQALTNPGAADEVSGVESVKYYYCPGACTPSPGTLIGTATTGPDYAFTWASQPADGTYSVVARVTDAAGNTTDSAVATTTIDNTGPRPTDVTLANGGVAKQVDTGDTVSIEFSEELDATTFCSTWTNSGAQTLSDVTVTIANAGSTDILTVASASCDFRLGSVVPGDYVSSNTTFDSSTIVWDPDTRTLTITIGAYVAGTIRTNQGAAKPSYAPDGGLTDLAGNGATTSKFTDSVATGF